MTTQVASFPVNVVSGVSHLQGISVLFVTHSPLLSAKCDRTIEVVDGCISASSENPKT